MPPNPPSQSYSLAGQDPDGPPASLWRDVWHRLAKKKVAVGGVWFVAALTLICFLGPALRELPKRLRPSGLSYSYQQLDLTQRVTPPGVRHWLGTDQLGRDVLARLLFGGRISLLVGLSATVVSLTIGLLYGALPASFGGKLVAPLSRTVGMPYRS